MPYLVALTGPYSGQAMEVKEGRTTVGRGPGCTLVLDQDPAISRAHAILVTAGGVVRVQDAGSTHGVYVNGRRVSEAVLRTGDCVQFGGSVFRLQPVPALVSEPVRLRMVLASSPSSGPVRDETPISAGAGCLFYGLAALLPIPVGFPVGLILGILYLRKSHADNRRFGAICLAISVLSLALVIAGHALLRSVLGLLQSPGGAPGMPDDLF